MPELTPREIQQALAQPFAPEDLEWRLQNTIEDKMRGLAVPYVTNRAMRIADIRPIRQTAGGHQQLVTIPSTQKKGT